MLSSPSSTSRVDGSGIGPSITHRFDSYLVRMKFSIFLQVELEYRSRFIKTPDGWEIHTILRGHVQGQVLLPSTYKYTLVYMLTLGSMLPWKRNGDRITNLLALAFPHLSTLCSCSSVQVSRSTDFTRLICVPIPLWIPEQRMQTKMPIFQLAHLGSIRKTGAILAMYTRPMVEKHRQAGYIYSTRKLKTK